LRAQRLATIGYETATLDEVIGKLRDAGVELLLDVRAVASSRRAGFSKSLLAGSLAQAGVDYLHLRALGTPKSGREAARAGRTTEMEAIYGEHLLTPEAQMQLAQAAELAEQRPSALLCYEADAAHCHRRIVADEIRRRTGLEVVDL
jgi:uncharacterized protein (DUF488 family)